MPGYTLVEIKNIAITKKNGILTHPNDIGFLDFLREIKQDPLPFPKFYKVQVRGLEEVLFASRPSEQEIAAKIRLLLRKASSNLEKRMLEVMVIFRGALVRGDDFWVEYRNVKIPIGIIFGNPRKQTDEKGNSFFKVNFFISG